MAGIDANVNLLGLDIGAEIHAELKKINDHNARMEARLRRETARARVPMDVRMFSSIVIPTPTARVGVMIGGPSAGYYWLLRRLVVGGTTFKTTAAGTAEVYVTGLGGEVGSTFSGVSANALVLSDLVDQATSLPNKAFYSNRQVIIQANENLVVLIDGGTAAQQYVAAAQFEVRRTVASEEIEFN